MVQRPTDARAQRRVSSAYCAQFNNCVRSNRVPGNGQVPGKLLSEILNRVLNIMGKCLVVLNCNVFRNIFFRMVVFNFFLVILYGTQMIHFFCSLVLPQENVIDPS